MMNQINCFLQSLYRIWALSKKEIISFLRSFSFYITAVFFLLFVSVRLYYLQNYFLLDAATLRPFFSSFPLAYIFMIPAITMKSWAEEKKTGTVELLNTMPFSEGELCIGKFLSSFLALLVILALSACVPLTLFILGSFDSGLIAAEYLGAILFGGTAISLGILFSSLSKNQISAFLSSSALLLILTLPQLFGAAAFLPAWLSGFINYISLVYHFGSFSRGVLDIRDIAFFILGTVLFLFLTTRVLILRKWQ